MPELFTEQEVAAMLKVRPTTIAKWRRAGNLPFTKMPDSNLVRFTRADIDAFIAYAQRTHGRKDNE